VSQMHRDASLTDGYQHVALPSTGSWEMLRQGWDGHVGVFAGAEADTKSSFPLLRPWTRLTSRLRRASMPRDMLTRHHAPCRWCRTTRRVCGQTSSLSL
jgi:hypothetical protein